MSTPIVRRWERRSSARRRGPRWLRKILDRGVDTRLLNDAAFAAARDLEKRAPERRKVILAISDGQNAQTVYRSEDTRDRLVRDQIQFYAVTVALPLLDKTTSLLRTYANATGGR